MMEKLIQNKCLFPWILKPRDKRAHKKSVGTVLVVGGSRGMTGAPALTALSAYRAGAGLVMLAFPDKLIEIYKELLLESLTLPVSSTLEGSMSPRAAGQILSRAKDYEAMVLGPGLSRNEETGKLIQELVKKWPGNLILDADGLNIIAEDPEILKDRPEDKTVLTPHEKEMARLLGTEEIDAEEREEVAVIAAKDFGATVVFKGYRTVISDGDRVVIDRVGGPELASAGTGDVLAGLLASLWAENLDLPFESAAAAVCLHGQAGRLAKKKYGQRSVIASDLIDFLPEAIKNCQCLEDECYKCHD